MYGLKEVYELDKKKNLYKCKGLINNAKFAFIADKTKNKSYIFTTLKRKDAKKEIYNFLECLENVRYLIEMNDLFIILDNI